MAFSGQTLPTSQRDVLIAFRDRLLDQIEYLSPKDCIVTDQPIPPSLPSVAPTRFVTVSMGPGQFDTGAYAGGGAATLNEVSTVFVTLFHQTRFDKAGDCEKRLLNEENGMLATFKFDVLKALAVDWMPCRADGTTGLLRNYPQPIRATMPQEQYLGEGAGKPFIAMQIDFDASFDWDFTA